MASRDVTYACSPEARDGVSTSRARTWLRRVQRSAASADDLQYTYTMTFSIRPFCSGDEPALIALWHAAGLTRPWNDPERDIARKRQVQAEWFLVAELDGELIGSVMAGYDGHRGWLNYLAIAPATRRRGYARALVGRAETLLRAAGCPKLNLQVRAENPSAIAFYEQLGYRQDAVVSLGKRLISEE